MFPFPFLLLRFKNALLPAGLTRLSMEKATALFLCDFSLSFEFTSFQQRSPARPRWHALRCQALAKRSLPGCLCQKHHLFWLGARKKKGRMQGHPSSWQQPPCAECINSIMLQNASLVLAGGVTKKGQRGGMQGHPSSWQQPPCTECINNNVW